MKIIGITGSIGSGKTTACKVFEMLGIPVYNADIEAKNILDNNSDVKAKIINTFGNSIIGENGLIVRPNLAAIVFSDKKKLDQLNAIVHPAVAKHFEDWINNNNAAKYVLKEAAILFESNAYKRVDKVITVTAPIELRIQRAISRDNSDKKTVEQRIKNQMSDEEKIKMSQFVITNDETQLLIPQIINIHQQLINS